MLPIQPTPIKNVNTGAVNPFHFRKSRAVFYRIIVYNQIYNENAISCNEL